MPCCHVGPCGVGCEGYTANPQFQPTPILVPLVLPANPLQAPYRTPEEYADLLQSHYSLCCKIAALEGELAKKDLQYNEALKAGQELNRRITTALNELGVPQPGYPAPVANAVDILTNGLKRKPVCHPWCRDHTDHVLCVCAGTGRIQIGESPEGPCPLHG